MDLYRYYHALAYHDDSRANPFIINLDESSGLAVVTYNILAPSFDWSIPFALDARGLVLDTTTGQVVARPYPKFFNYGENESAVWPADTTGMVVEEKLDGSLAIVSTYKDELIVSSSGSLTSAHADTFKHYLQTQLTDEQLGYLKQLGETYTLLFEYVGPANKVVIQYDKENMILHGAIETSQTSSSIVELPHDKLSKIADGLGVDVVKTYPVTSLATLLDECSTVTSYEGFVVKWPNGYRLKFKTADYISKHRLATELDINVDSKQVRKTFVQAIVTESYDDLTPYLVETRSLLDKMVASAKEFIKGAASKHEVFIQENERLIEEDVDIKSIREMIVTFADRFADDSKVAYESLMSVVSQSDDELLDKGQAQIANAFYSSRSNMANTYRSFSKNVARVGLVDKTKLRDNQRRLVISDSSESIIDKCTRDYLLNGDMMDAVKHYLTAVYVNDVELAATQKAQRDLNAVQKAFKLLDKLDLSEESKRLIEATRAIVESDVSSK